MLQRLHVRKSVHEVIYRNYIFSNFSNYKARFTMPEDDFGHKPEQGKDMFYSFNLGPIHFVSINTEYYYYQDEPWNFKQCVLRQYDWLKNDLQVQNLYYQNFR